MKFQYFLVGVGVVVVKIGGTVERGSSKAVEGRDKTTKNKIVSDCFENVPILMLFLCFSFFFL
jgi:hypothetical protein